MDKTRGNLSSIRMKESHKNIGNKNVMMPLSRPLNLDWIQKKLKFQHTCCYS